MLDSRRLRLLTAVLVATWSPGHWCCCSVQAAQIDDASLAATTAEDCHADSCCTEGEPAADPSSAAPAGGCCDPVGPGPRDSCPCLDAPMDAVPTLAAGSPSPGKPAGKQIDLLAELSPALAGIVAGGRHEQTCRGSPRPLGALSLLSQHCMLTT